MTKDNGVTPDQESPRSVGETRLSKSITIDKYKQLEAQEDKQAIAAFIVERFDERYFNPVMNSCSKHGFTMMAVGCVVIETLESFYQGLEDTKHKSGEMFAAFFERETSLKQFRNVATFYQDVRCGILHQAEVRGGWRITRKNGAPLLDEDEKTINAELFISGLRAAVLEYVLQLQADPKLWGNLKNKMKQVCANCERDNVVAQNKLQGGKHEYGFQDAGIGGGHVDNGLF